MRKPYKTDLTDAQWKLRMMRRLAPDEARKPIPFTYEKRKAA